jgi:hypothetical protein
MMPGYGSHVDLDGRALGHDIRSRAAADHPRIEGHARDAPVQPVQGDDLVRGLEDGAATVLRSYACVSRPPVEVEAQLHPTLPALA